MIPETSIHFVLTSLVFIFTFLISEESRLAIAAAISLATDVDPNADHAFMDKDNVKVDHLYNDDLDMNEVKDNE